jgi:hypothetical protein
VSTAMKIKDLLDETQGMSAAKFQEEFPYPFLVKEATNESIPAPAEDRATTRLKTASAPIGDGFAQGDVWIYPVRPRDPENFKGAVKLGRDPDLDVVINDGSISTEHAKFTLDFEGDEPIVSVVDVGSSNGTYVNGDKIEPNAPKQLSDQDSVRFGPAVKLQFFESEGFFQFLSFYRRIKKRH